MFEVVEPFLNIIFLAIAAIVAMATAYFTGSQSGKQKEVKKQLQKSLDNVQKAQENDHEIDSLNKIDVDKRLIDNGWMRDDT